MALVRGSRTLGSLTRPITIRRCNDYIYVSSCSYYGRLMIGSREVVGYGCNGSYDYFDRMDLPYPAIRFKEVKGDLVDIKEKEKGDWKNLTVDEKKALYRASFCRTFAELESSSTGEWKSVLGCTLFGVSCGLWLFLMIKWYICDPMPPSMSEKNKEKQLEWYVKIRVDPIDGIGSLYDYENDCWKGKKPWYQWHHKFGF